MVDKVLDISWINCINLKYVIQREVSHRDVDNKVYLKLKLEIKNNRFEIKII